MTSGGHVVEKEMAITHHDFMRLLPKAFDGGEIKVDGRAIRVVAGAGELRIDLSEESVRRIANLEIPLTLVRLTFSGYEEAETEAMLARFWRTFQKGGG